MATDIAAEELVPANLCLAMAGIIEQPKIKHKNQIPKYSQEIQTKKETIFPTVMMNLLIKK